MKTLGTVAVGILSYPMLLFTDSTLDTDSGGGGVSLPPLFLFVFRDCSFTLFYQVIFRGLNS